MYTSLNQEENRALGPRGCEGSCLEQLTLAQVRLRDVVATGRSPAGGLHSISHLSKFSLQGQSVKTDTGKSWGGEGPGFGLGQPGTGCHHSNSQLQGVP